MHIRSLSSPCDSITKTPSSSECFSVEKFLAVVERPIELKSLGKSKRQAGEIQSLSGDDFNGADFHLLKKEGIWQRFI